MMHQVCGVLTFRLVLFVVSTYSMRSKYDIMQQHCMQNILHLTCSIECDVTKRELDSTMEIR